MIQAKTKTNKQQQNSLLLIHSENLFHTDLTLSVDLLCEMRIIWRRFDSMTNISTTPLDYLEMAEMA